jgi:hypothetical protein
MIPTYLILNSPTCDLAQYGERNSSHGAAISAIPFRLSAAKTHTQRNVKKFLTDAAPIAALCTLAFVSFGTPASAYEYCHIDDNGTKGCAHDTLEQCHATRSGRSTVACLRDPFLGYSNTAFAYAPKTLLLSGPDIRRTKTPIKNQ